MPGEPDSLERIAASINLLAKFCGKRDLPRLTRRELQAKYRIDQADVMVLFGGSILAGGDILAEAVANRVAGKYVIVGGIGHTTAILRREMRRALPAVATAGRPEAELFAAYLKTQYGLEPDLLECRSTNCGSNITGLLELLRQNGIPFQSIILAQDATMQHRMEAGFRRFAPAEVTIINYATYAASVVCRNGKLVYENTIRGMWTMKQYITLLLGEIPRLSDDAAGYGPNGRNFIAHVDIPADVRKAFQELQQEYTGLVRRADPRYASKNP
ncbi:ElyC/SanA/YdcF family protein [Victivallis sp. Marseille-Q1083]|uniref:ElyC/SanA/YdcF family protein n=1 Tax=Victivallis sp. Marseille-Q1083 TaxID=2717288 RepID=UPI00158B21F9|nr:ElyC/SanA/YdcF family protein [Victivallis sp. Marseille-Q1083]